MNVQLETGNTISVSVYEYYFVLKDEDMHEFFQACVADNLGIEINDPWSGRASMGRLEFDESTDLEEIEETKD